MPRRTEPPARLRSRPFTWSEASAAGMTKHQLRTSQFRHVFRDVWVHRDLPDDRSTRLEAAAKVAGPHAVLCGLTAAWVHGADVRREQDLDVHVAYPRGKRRRARAGIIVSQESLGCRDVWDVGGVRVTSPLRTAFDCLRLLPDPLGLVVADALTHLRLTSVPDLERYFSAQRRLRNLRVGERLVPDIEPAAESPMETRSRVSLVRAGLPRPVAQHVVLDPAGVFVARLDLAYPDRKVAVEYDGAWHWAQHRQDERRRARLRELGWTVIVVSADDLYDDRLVGLVRRALRAAA